MSKKNVLRTEISVIRINDGVPQEKKIVALNKTEISQMRILTDEDKISKIIKQNFHAEIDTGKPVGKEIW